MNLGWYEIMDRIAMLQTQLHDTVYEHSVTDANLQYLIDDAQQWLNRAYSYASDKFRDSCEDEEMLYSKGD